MNLAAEYLRDADGLIRAIVDTFNCAVAEADSLGDIWIADPQEGHWLTADERDKLIRNLERQRGI